MKPRFPLNSWPECAGTIVSATYVVACRRSGRYVLHAAGPRRIWPHSCVRCRPDVPLLWVGLGSNLLVRDGGIRGVVVATAGAFTRIERRSQSRIYCRGRRAVRAHRQAMRQMGTGAR